MTPLEITLPTNRASCFLGVTRALIGVEIVSLYCPLIGPCTCSLLEISKFDQSHSVENSLFTAPVSELLFESGLFRVSGDMFEFSHLDEEEFGLTDSDDCLNWDLDGKFEGEASQCQSFDIPSNILPEMVDMDNHESSSAQHSSSNYFGLLSLQEKMQQKLSTDNVLSLPPDQCLEPLSPDSHIPGISDDILDNSLDETCSVCLCETVDVQILPCGHLFHRQCIETSLRKLKEVRCPNCRTEVTTLKPVKFNYHQADIISSHPFCFDEDETVGHGAKIHGRAPSTPSAARRARRKKKNVRAVEDTTGNSSAPSCDPTEDAESVGEPNGRKSVGEKRRKRDSALSSDAGRTPRPKKKKKKKKDQDNTSDDTHPKHTSDGDGSPVGGGRNGEGRPDPESETSLPEGRTEPDSSTTTDDVLHCNCTGGCKNGRCACVKEMGACSKACKCTGCHNPFLLLEKEGVHLDELKADECFMQNMLKKKPKTLLDKLQHTAVVPCCHTRLQVKHVVMGYTCTPCNMTYKYSWCSGLLCDVQATPRNHCSACRKCGDYRDRHCENCGRCYFAGASRSYDCPCKENRSFRDFAPQFSYTYIPNRTRRASSASSSMSMGVVVATPPIPVIPAPEDPGGPAITGGGVEPSTVSGSEGNDSSSSSSSTNTITEEVVSGGGAPTPGTPSAVAAAPLAAVAAPAASVPSPSGTVAAPVAAAAAVRVEAKVEAEVEAAGVRAGVQSPENRDVCGPGVGDKRDGDGGTGVVGCKALRGGGEVGVADASAMLASVVDAAGPSEEVPLPSAEENGECVIM